MTNTTVGSGAAIAGTASAADDGRRYSFDNADSQGLRQLTLLADILDPHSEDVLINTGVDIGWRCLDVGAGAGTITHFLAGQVGETGQVSAIDLDPRHIALRHNVEVRQVDIRTAELPAEHFDLIHTRLLLLHLPERDAVLDRLVAALRPGGLLVVSDWDATRRDWLLHAPDQPSVEAFEAFQTGLLDVLVSNGADLGWARRAPLAARSAGLTQVRTVVHNRLWAGGEPGCLLHESNAAQLREPLLAAGVSAAELDRLGEAMQEPETLAYSYWMFSTVAQRPE